jgi:hypothetical protein
MKRKKMNPWLRATIDCLFLYSIMFTVCWVLVTVVVWWMEK